MVWQATRAGLGAAARNGRLAATLWLVNLALAATAALPLWRALADAIGPLPGADRLAEAFSFGVIADLGELRPGFVAGLANAMGARIALENRVGADGGVQGLDAVIAIPQLAPRHSRGGGNPDGAAPTISKAAGIPAHGFPPARE